MKAKNQSSPIAVFACAFFFIFCWGLFTHQAQAQVPSRYRWRVIESEHFKVIFSEDQDSLARKLLLDLEKGRPKWMPYFSTDLGGKLPVAIMDTLDLTNGFAAPLPYPFMGVYPVLPAPQDSIYEHQDWFYELAVHELGHIYTFEARTGGARFLHSIFGQIITPNIFLPRWWHEGIAVTGETYLSKGGRLRSNYQDASLRALSQADRLMQPFPLERINQFDLPEWPFGATPYLYGSLFFHELENLSPQAGKALHERLGGRFPFFLENQFFQTYQRVPQFHFDQTLLRAQDLAQSQIKVLAQTQNSKTQPLFSTTQGIGPGKMLETFAPALSPDGSLMAFVARDSSRRSSLKIFKRNSETQDFIDSKPWGSFSERESHSQERSSPIPTPGPGFTQSTTASLSPKAFFDFGSWIDSQQPSLPQNLSIQRIAWHPKESALVFDTLGRAEPLALRSDLWIYDLNRKRARPWTRGFRLREASVSPSGEWVAAVQLDAGFSKIVLLPYPSDHFPLGRVPWRTARSSSKHPWLSEVFRSELGSLLSWPVWLSETEIAFVKKTGLTSELIHLTLGLSLDEQNPNARALTANQIPLPEQDISYPLVRKSARDSSEIWFVGNLSGVRNIYSLRSDKPQASLRAQTHLVTQSFSFALDSFSNPPKLIFTHLTSDGVQLHQTEPLDWPKEKLPQIGTLYPELDLKAQTSHSQTFSSQSAGPASTQMPAISEPRPYSSFPYLLPNYWIPLVLFDERGVFVSAQTSSFDPLQRQSYSLFASYDSDIKKTNFTFLYGNRVFYPSLGLIAQEFHSRLAGQNESRQNSNYSLLMDLPLWDSELPFFDRDSFFNPRRLLWNLELSGGFIRRTLFTSPAEGAVGRLGIRYQNLSQSGQQVGPEGGSSFFARYLYFDLQKPEFSNSEDQKLDKVEVSYSQFWRMSSAFHNSTQLQLNYSHFLKPLVPLSLYDSSENTGSLGVPTLSQLQLRGFPAGTFIAKNYLSGSLNWSFPISRLDWGNATAPWYLKRLVGSVGLDGAQLKGLIYNRENRSYLVRNDLESFFSAGFELKWEMTLFFLADVGVITGVHFPFAHRDLTDTSPYWVIGLAAAGF